jgi:uncharacterized protein (TIGR02284 family)
MYTEMTTALSEETLSTLQNLIQRNIDSRDGFNEAAQNMDNLTIESLFRELAAQRSEQASELGSLVALNRTAPQSRGSMAAAAHRAWMDLRSAMGGGTMAMVQEAERGENMLKTAYESALVACAGSPVSEMLNRHYLAIKTACERLCDLKTELNS